MGIMDLLGMLMLAQQSNAKPAVTNGLSVSDAIRAGLSLGGNGQPQGAPIGQDGTMSLQAPVQATTGNSWTPPKSVTFDELDKTFDAAMHGKYRLADSPYASDVEYGSEEYRRRKEREQNLMNLMQEMVDRMHVKARENKAARGL